MADKKIDPVDAPEFNETDPKVLRHQVDAVTDPALFEEANVNAPVPKKADPFAHQREGAPQEEEAAKEQKEGAAAAKKQTVLKEGSGR